MQFKCPLDGFELVLYTLGSSGGLQGKAFPLCPHCYNHPPVPTLTNMGCNVCPHPTCQHRCPPASAFHSDLDYDACLYLC